MENTVHVQNRRNCALGGLEQDKALLSAGVRGLVQNGCALALTSQRILVSLLVLLRGQSWLELGAVLLSSNMEKGKVLWQMNRETEVWKKFQSPFNWYHLVTIPLECLLM